MRFSLRILLIAILGLVPFLAQAQMYKCKQPDGSVAYQDSKCPSESSTMKVLPSWSQGSDSMGASSPIMKDPVCREELVQSTLICGTAAAVRQCFHERLSQSCWSQVEVSGPGGANTGSCKKEVQEATEPCGKRAAAATGQCLQQKLSPICVAKLGPRK